MRTYPDCFPCFFRQANIALEQARIDEDRRIELLRDISRVLSKCDFSNSPAHVTTHIHRYIREKIGGDPFKDIKSSYNRKVLDIYDDMKSLITESEDPLCTATRIAIAGNIIDFGIFTSVDMEGTIEKALGEKIAVDDYYLFRDDAGKAGSVLYLLDNAGEIVFDKLLIETLMASGMDVTAVVKGQPVLNDAVYEDAHEIGLDKICRVIDNGSDAVGTIISWCSEDFKREFSDAELVISKGQANFETLLHEEHDNLYFLFQAKCSVIAGHLGLDRGAMILARGLEYWKSGV
ncbi:hypothetical protein BMS3Abin07_00862 [bacterium BMS3Abin07]|nr:hypothetical protein BMS3Abin07_00862 [bacterium BMS3Abin07]GBE31668.1 hypothetical protein BMS3Bbin05_00571 [bacterium BMS3Bbin05]HDO22719.1 DUF89 family protein [Nitrospirota bacterium]HDZ88517.1 DUF89 family protein [Nitrospirota bacterium]